MHGKLMQKLNIIIILHKHLMHNPQIALTYQKKQIKLYNLKLWHSLYIHFFQIRYFQNQLQICGNCLYRMITFVKF